MNDEDDDDALDPMEDQITSVVADMHEIGLHRPRSIRESMDIGPEDVSSEYRRIIGDIGYHLAVATEAHRDLLIAKQNAERLKAQLFLATKRKAVDDDAKPPSDKTIEMMVRADSRMVRSLGDLVEAQTVREQTQNACAVLSTKKDMLISLGAHVRTEMGGIPSLRDAPDPDKANPDAWPKDEIFDPIDDG